MKIKILLFLGFSLFSFCVFSQGPTTAIWNPTQNPNTTYKWTEGANWALKDGVYPNDLENDVVDIGQDDYPAAGQVIVDDSVNCFNLKIGNGGENEAVLRVVKGGYLNTGKWWSGIGWNSPGKLMVEKGGTMTFGEHMWIGWNADATAIIEGVVNVTAMYGSAFEGQSGSGYCYVKNGGILNLAQLHPDKSFPNASFIDISGGSIKFKGDGVALISTLIENGKIKAYEENAELTVTYNAEIDSTIVTAASVVYQVDLSQVNDLQQGGKVWVIFGDGADYEEMTDENGDGIFVASVTADRVADLTYKFEYQNGAGENDRASENLTGKDCGNSEGLRTIADVPVESVLVLPPVLFNSCDVAAEKTQQATTVWTGAKSTFWHIPENWSDGFIPKDNKVVFNVPTAPECFLGVESSIKQFVIGDGGDGGTLHITSGGNLTTTSGWSGIGWSAPGKMIVDAGGTVNFAEHAWIGWESNATLELNGGTINIKGMYGTAFEGGSGTASVYIKEGVLNLAQLHDTKSIPEGSFMDITGGTVNITGDKSTVVNAYIAAGRIKAYDGEGTVNVNIVDGNTILTGTAPRQATTVWDPASNPASTGLWSEAKNWSDKNIPLDNKVVFNKSDAQECLLNIESSIKQFVLGDGDTGGTLRITEGGTLTTTSGWSGIGWSHPATMIVETGGTVTLAEHLWVGWDGAATLQLNGGTINVKGMYGTAFEGGKGTAAVTINSGILNLAELHDTKSIPEGSFMDIKEGTVKIAGDKTIAVNAYAVAGKIIAYGGNGTLNVTFADGFTTITATAVRNETTVWNPAGNPSITGLWNDAANWTDGMVPDNNKVVTNVPGAIECVLDTISTIKQFVLGDGNEGGTLRIANGGTLTTTSGWSGLGWTAPATMIVDEGGTVNLAEHFWVGWESNAILILNGGTINVTGMFGTAFEGGKGTALVTLKRGVLNLAQLHDTKSIPEGSLMNLEYGILKITGDKVAIVNAYADAGRIIAFGGSGTISVSFADGITTVLAIPAKGATTVWEPANNNAATGLWSDFMNWSDRHIPGDNKVVFNRPDAIESVLDTESTIKQLVMGDGNGGGILRITNGGILSTTSGWSGIAWTHPAKLIVETGGVFNFGSHAWIGWGGDATVEINGGTINVAGMYGTAFEGNPGGSATVHVNSGQLNLQQFHPEKSIPEGSVIDIKEGVVKITGDHVNVVNAYKELGRITAYGGSGQLFVNFDGTFTIIEAKDWTVSAEEISGNFSGRVYPNPTNGIITIENPSNSEFSFSIYSITGKMVLSKNNISGLSTQVDMSGMVKGIYLFKIHSSEKILMLKVILQ